MTVFERTYNPARAVRVENMSGNAFTGESGAHQFRISGNFTGTISGYMIRSDGSTVTVAGENDSGVAVLTLNADCYNVPGRFTLTIFDTVDEQSTTCIYACTGTVARSTTGTAVDSGEIVPDLQTVTAAYQAAVAAVAGLDAITGHNLAAGIEKVNNRCIRYDTGGSTSQSGYQYKTVDVTGISAIVYTRLRTTIANTKIGMAFHDGNGDFIPGSGEKLYATDSAYGFVMSAIDVPTGAATASFSWRNSLDTDGFVLGVYDKASYDFTLAGRVFALEQAAQPVALMTSALTPTDGGETE